MQYMQKLIIIKNYNTTQQFELTCFSLINFDHSSHPFTDWQRHRFQPCSTVFKDLVVLGETLNGSIKVHLSHLVKRKE